MVHSNGSNGKTLDEKGRDICYAGWVRLTEGGASVSNKDGHIYRVDFDLGGKPHCQCRYFEHHGDCKHLRAAYLLAWQADYDRYQECMLDAGRA